MTAPNVIAEFIKAGSVPMDGSDHVSGDLAHATALLSANPNLTKADIYAASVAGDAHSIAELLNADRSRASTKGGPYQWDPLTYLCFSRFLRLRKDSSDKFVRAATLLLDAGASPNTGYYSDEHLPKPVWESAIYGAAGVAHDPRVTQLLLDRGADPNDEETAYHASEWFDNRAMEVLVNSGKLSTTGMLVLLHRKIDWTDFDAVKWLLEKGANPNATSPWKHTALEHALERDSELRLFELLLEHGADPTAQQGSAIERAAAMGRGDVLKLFELKGFDAPLTPEARFLAACASGDRERALELARSDAELVKRAEMRYPAAIANFAGAGNTDGLRLLLDLGMPLDSTSSVAGFRNVSPLHLAVWRERTDTVKLLLDKGAKADARDARGVTPLDLARRAQTEQSEWTPHKSREILDLLLARQKSS